MATMFDGRNLCKCENISLFLPSNVAAMQTLYCGVVGIYGLENCTYLGEDACTRTGFMQCGKALEFHCLSSHFK